MADSGDSADSLGFGPGERVIQEQRHRESSDSVCCRDTEVTLELSQAEEGSGHSGKCVVRQFPDDLLYLMWKS